MLEKYPVQLEDRWSAAGKSHYMHTFVIPADLARTIQTMTVATKVDQMFPVKLDKNMKKQGLMNDVVITINPKL
ncbi:hypothetical protein L914_06471 [Phytophthora nicotianae]|uniref:Uncharacterized protein n=1 Tax=Phytophthora nicotianae TaxID=4792 RepID=W2NKF7_PHYNI|nr:hypothetical protein L914_06471 [Phytophthora nicotianae]